jgi:hypothetical protein
MSPGWAARLSLIQRYWAVLPAKAAGSGLPGMTGEDYVAGLDGFIQTRRRRFRAARRRFGKQARNLLIKADWAMARRPAQAGPRDDAKPRPVLPAARG